MLRFVEAIKKGSQRSGLVFFEADVALGSKQDLLIEVNEELSP